MKSRLVYEPKAAAGLANELPKNLKTSDDLSQFDGPSKKISVMAARIARMSCWMEYGKKQPEPESGPRNGYTIKTVNTGDSTLKLPASRDRNAVVKPQRVHTTGMDNQILALYARA